MEFPITKERLRNYRMQEAFQAEVNMRVANRTAEICKNIENVVLQTNEQKYRYNILDFDKYGLARPTSGPQIPTGGILKELISSLKTRFPDSEIVMDPLKTYILIDWSE